MGDEDSIESIDSPMRNRAVKIQSIKLERKSIFQRKVMQQNRIIKEK